MPLDRARTLKLLGHHLADITKPSNRPITVEGQGLEDINPNGSVPPHAPIKPLRSNRHLMTSPERKQAEDEDLDEAKRTGVEDDSIQIVSTTFSKNMVFYPSPVPYLGTGGSGYEGEQHQASPESPLESGADMAEAWP